MFSRVLCIGTLLATIGAAPAATSPASLGFIAAVKTTGPVAYFQLNAKRGSAEVGNARYKLVGGAHLGPGAPIGITGNRALWFNGTSGYVDTTYHGGIGTAGSMMAWINLSTLPSKASHVLYVGGESQDGNDFDIQFEGDNALHFYTAQGSNVKYAPDPSTLVHQWHMVVVTVDFRSGARAIYWDGTLAASDTGFGAGGKTKELSFGESKVFTGRFFSGAISQTALWNRALGAPEVAAIYASTKGS